MFKHSLEERATASEVLMLLKEIKLDDEVHSECLPAKSD